MKLTFPHMGYSYVAFKMLIEDLGYEVVVPPEPSGLWIWVSVIPQNFLVFLSRYC